jgi:hypothetical protein
MVQASGMHPKNFLLENDVFEPNKENLIKKYELPAGFYLGQ